MEEIAKLKGTNGTIIVYDDRVVISRKGIAAIAAQGFKGDRTIYFKDISSVDFKKPGWINGYIQFIVPGTSTVSASSSLISTSKDTMKDPNTVVLRALNRKTPGESEKLYKLLLQKIDEYRNTKANDHKIISAADEIAKYKKLLDDGAITNNEFDKKKKELLGI